MPGAARRMLLITALLAHPLPGYLQSRGSARAGAGQDHPSVAGTDGAACTKCHAEVTVRRVMHGPVAMGNCSACHVATNGRLTLKGGASSRNTARLCVSCHEEIADRLKQDHRHAPVSAGDCTACHDPHGSAFRFQLSAEGNGACLACHQDIAQALAQPYAHAPAEASCQICHDPHAAKHRSQLRAGGNTVCLPCHFDAPAGTTGTDALELFGRRSAGGIDRLIAAGSRIRLDGTRMSGHPTIRHPVDERPDPTDEDRTLGCASCHNPHGAVGEKLLRFGAIGVSSLCIRCHKM